ncbi:hypothetical protein JHK87_021044 [Glycine soja]|nr:hypothetical protein JHK87_021044 [Glycine soja]
MLPDKFGNSALHIAKRKMRVEVLYTVPKLIQQEHQRECINKGAQNSSSYCSIPSTIRRNPRDKRFPTSFRCSQCQQSEPAKGRVHQEHRDTNQKGRSHTARTRRTNKNVNGIAMELRKLNRAGVNNATNSVTVVAVLFVTLALAAIFSVPGGDYDNGVAVMVGTIPFYIFFIFDAVAL